MSHAEEKHDMNVLSFVKPAFSLFSSHRRCYQEKECQTNCLCIRVWLVVINPSLPHYRLTSHQWELQINASPDSILFE